MRRPWRAIVVLAVGSPVLGSCRDGPPTPVAQEAMQEMAADYVVYGEETYLTINGVRSGSVDADSAYVYNDSAENHLFGVRMTLFTEDGAVRARLTAETGVLQQRTEAMVARGNVVLDVLDQGMQVQTPELHYDPSSERISSDSSTVVIQNGRTTRGTGFRSDLQFHNWILKNPRGAITAVRGGSGSGR